MTERPDLSLPMRVPEMEQYHDSPEDILPFALYTLCNLRNDRLEAYRELCTTDVETDSVKLPPRSDFQNESLRSIVDYHVGLGRAGDFDPVYFIVCAYAECSTVVFVTLDEDLNCKPDLMWTRMDESGLLGVNLQIGNTDWGEAKEGDLGGPQWDQPGPGDPPEARQERAAATSEQQQSQEDDDEDEE